MDDMLGYGFFRVLTELEEPPLDAELPPCCDESPRLEIRYLIVVQGARMTSSWSRPNMFAPFRDSTPTTRMLTDPRRISLPIASSSPNSSRFTICPMTQTRFALRTSDSVNTSPSD